eukprot:1558664-Rhodomonas_salina.8
MPGADIGDAATSLHCEPVSGTMSYIVLCSPYAYLSIVLCSPYAYLPIGLCSYNAMSGTDIGYHATSTS